MQFLSLQLQQDSRLQQDRLPEEDGALRHREGRIRCAVCRDAADAQGLLRHVWVQPQELRQAQVQCSLVQVMAVAFGCVLCFSFA